MTRNHTIRRRRTVAATLAVALLALPGCAAWSETAGETAGAEPSTSAPVTSAAPTPSEPPATPSETPSTTPSETPSPTPSPTPEPSASPSSTPSSDGEGDRAEEEQPSGADEDESTPDEKDDEKTEEAEEAEPEYPQVGASGDVVTALQTRLQDLGYYLPDADGKFGPMTQQAVWALQKAAGLGRDGVVGPKTQKALDDGVRPGPESSSGKVVEIDLDRQLIKAVEDGKVVRTINASSGNGETFEAKGRTYTASTPRGTFAVYMERDYLHESTLELGSMYRPKYFTGGIAVHGSGSIPPYPASHGCIRVSNSAMNWLWDSWGMPKGTTVIVY